MNHVEIMARAIRSHFVTDMAAYNVTQAALDVLKEAGLVIVPSETLAAFIEEASYNEASQDHDRFWKSRDELLAIIEAAESE